MRTLQFDTLALALAALLLGGTGAARAAPGAHGRVLVPIENTDASACGLTTPAYGTIGIGSVVTLARHTPWTGPTGDPSAPYVTADDNWNEGMDAYVGRRAVVVEVSGLDMAGCAGVRVDIDERHWFWRVRDLAHGRPGGGGLRN